MAAEGMQFPWRGNGGTIFLNLGVIWEMSVGMHGARAMTNDLLARLKHEAQIGQGWGNNALVSLLNESIDEIKRQRNELQQLSDQLKMANERIVP